MHTNTIQKYSKYSVAQLKAKAQKVFNAWIRKRDEGKPCISCGSGKPDHAGHYFSAGHHSKLRFDERNVAGQCIRCNYFLHGNQTGYRQGLIKRIGIEAVEQIESEASIKGAYKWDRFSLIKIIEHYK
jgi:hypothetical protein